MEYYIFLRKLKLKYLSDNERGKLKNRKKEKAQEKAKRTARTTTTRGNNLKPGTKKRPPDFHRRPSSNLPGSGGLRIYLV